jgi:hypothetical protein
VERPIEVGILGIDALRCLGCRSRVLRQEREVPVDKPDLTRVVGEDLFCDGLKCFTGGTGVIRELHEDDLGLRIPSDRVVVRGDIKYPSSPASREEHMESPPRRITRIMAR